MWQNLQETDALVTFTEEILNGTLTFFAVNKKKEIFQAIHIHEICSHCEAQAKYNT